MPTINLDAVSKSYGSNKVIDEFTAEVSDQEFLVLLGPSGCGKSTMLRMIAGLTEISSGELRFDDVVVNDQTPKERNIAFVFQSYALYPHMTVRANIAFPLIMDENRWWHHLPLAGSLARRAILRKPDIADRVEEVAATLELTPYLDRRPKALSGGQRQRVALARSLVREPAVYLLDEPLSNLDAKLRAQMRAEISQLHHRVQKTFVYVTHDQVEAMTMGTKIIVLNEGVVQQYATPRDLYHQPANLFVASFVGSPPMNLLAAEVTDSGLTVAGELLPSSADRAATPRSQGLTKIILGIRPEKVSLGAPDSDSTGTLPGTITTVEDLGPESVAGFTIDNESRTELSDLPTSGRLRHAKASADFDLLPGAPCRVRLALNDAVFFHPETGDRV